MSPFCIKEQMTSHVTKKILPDLFLQLVLVFIAFA